MTLRKKFKIHKKMADGLFFLFLCVIWFASSFISRAETTLLDKSTFIEQKLSAECDGTVITVSGLMPQNSTLVVTSVDSSCCSDFLQNAIGDENLQAEPFRCLDISVLVDKMEYQPRDYEEALTVTMQDESLRGQQEDILSALEGYHVSDMDTVERVYPYYIADDTVEFVTDSFSTYTFGTYSLNTTNGVHFSNSALEGYYYADTKTVLITSFDENKTGGALVDDNNQSISMTIEKLYITNEEEYFSYPLSELDDILGNPAITDLYIANVFCIADIPNSYKNTLKRAYFPNNNYVGKWAFKDFVKLEFVDLHDTESFMSEAFYNCANLKELYIPKATNIGDYMFYNCGIEKLYNIPNVKYIGEYAFYKSKIREIYAPSVKKIYNNAFEEAEIEKVCFLDIETVGNSAFKNSNLKIGIFDNVDITHRDDRPTFGDRAFYGCKNLTQISMRGLGAILGEEAFAYSGKEGYNYLDLSGFSVVGKGCFLNSNWYAINLGGVDVLPDDCFKNCKNTKLYVITHASGGGTDSFYSGCTTPIDATIITSNESDYKTQSGQAFLEYLNSLDVSRTKINFTIREELTFDTDTCYNLHYYKKINGRYIDKGSGWYYTQEPPNRHLSSNYEAYPFDYRLKSYEITRAFSLSNGYGTASYYYDPIIRNISYSLNGGTWNTGYQPPSTYCADVETALPIESNLTRKGYSFKGWTHQGVAITELPLNYTYDIELVAQWEKKDIITFDASFDANMGKFEDGTSSMTKTFSEEDDSFVLPTPSRIGYTFGGWYTSATSGTKLTSFSQLNSLSSKTLYAHWTANTNTAYVVKHYKENLSDGDYTLADTENLTGTTDSEITPAVKTYTGFTAQSTQSVTIAGDGSTVVEYQYTRNSYALTLNAGTGIESVSGAGTYKYESKVEVSAIPSEGYSFANWTNGSKQLSASASYTVKVTEDTSLTATATADDKTAPQLTVMDDKPTGQLFKDASKKVTLIAFAEDDVSADNELLYQFMDEDGTMLADWQEDNHLILYPRNGNGTYIIKVKDTAGNVATKEYILTAWDLEAPKLTVKVSPESTEEPYVQERTVTALANDNSAGKTNVASLPEKPYYVEEKTYNYQYHTSVSREMEKEFTQTLHITAGRSGTYVIYARDSAGNLTHENVVIQGIDTLPPEVDYFTQLSADSKSVIVGIKARDVRADRYSEMSGLTTDESGAYTCFSLSDKSIELVRSELNANGWVYSAFQTPKNVNLLLTVQDKAGNSQTCGIQVNADRIREESAYNPIEDILLTNSDDSTYPACTGASVTAEIVLLDGCVESDYAYCFDYRGYVAGKKDNGTGTWASGRKKTFYANGTYHAYIKDEFGFVYEKTFEVKNIDRTKPVIQATGSNDGSIRITVTDNLSGLDYIRVTGNSLEQIKEYRNLNGVLSDTEVYTSTGDGGTFQIVAYDMAGNASSPVKVFVDGKNAVQEESIKLKVTFRNYRNVAVKNVTVDKYGKAVAPKDTQMRRSGYLFAGWDTSFERVEQNLSVRPVYVEDRNKEGYFMVVFKDSDGTVLKAENVARGSEATPPSAPEKEGKTFIGWSSTAYQNVQGNTILVAQYR